MNKKEVKEDSQFQFRINYTLREEFKKMCKDNGTDAAKELREYVVWYVKKNKKRF